MLTVCISCRLQETLDRFSAKLESVYKASGGKKINIITHSMGGLLVKCFMCLHSDVSVDFFDHFKRKRGKIRHDSFINCFDISMLLLEDALVVLYLCIGRYL